MRESAPLIPVMPVVPSLAEIIRPELPFLAAEIVDAVALHVPELATVLSGDARARARHDVRDVLEAFVECSASGEPAIPDQTIQLHDAFITRAFFAGCDLATLHSAYRVGARVTWRRLSAIAGSAGAAPSSMYSLAEHLFAQLERISTESTETFDKLGADPVTGLTERRRRLARLLLADPPAGSHAVLRLARDAEWRLPERAACVAVDGRSRPHRRLPLALDADVLVDFERSDPCLLIPSPELPGRLSMLRRGLDGIQHALGPTVELSDVALSMRLARRALSLAQDGLLPDDNGHVHCEDHLPTLHLDSDEGCIRIIADRAVSAFSVFTPDRRARLQETLFAYLTTRSSLVEVAERLQVHPQTVRYRMRQIEELFGERIHDPDWRFEMELALRRWRLHTAKPPGSRP